MDKQIRWSLKALNSFEEICSYIASDSKYYASLFAKRIIAIIKDIPKFPQAGRVVPEYNNKKLREKIYQNYRIVYRIKKNYIEIVAIIHSARQIENII
jgi:plasmid stabilization system protein ParE